MLEGRSFEYFPNLKLIKIKGLPPEGWYDLTTEQHFKEFKNIAKFEMDIESVQFDY